MNDSITGGLGDNSRSSEGFTLQLYFIETTFEIAFTCVTFTIAFFGFVGNLVTVGEIVRDPKYHTPTFAAIGLLALADFLSVTFFSLINGFVSLWIKILFWITKRKKAKVKLSSLSGCVTDNREKPDVVKHVENTGNQNWGMLTKIITIRIWTDGF
uniref:G-protein coupled receptors family 1 profile domain-containing protein n=1 Tax=Magallana gigas TaxID=29159 RepID=A0A8W8LJ44_MAGGI